MESPAFPPDSERAMVEFMNEHYAHSNLMYAKVMASSGRPRRPAWWGWIRQAWSWT